MLDNFEQAIGALGVVTALVKAAPDVKVLATSREKLNVYGEHEYEVPPLSSARREGAAVTGEADPVRSGRAVYRESTGE